MIIKLKKNSALGQSIFVKIRSPPVILWYLVRRVRLFVLFVVIGGPLRPRNFRIQRSRNPRRFLVIRPAILILQLRIEADYFGFEASINFTKQQICILQMLVNPQYS